MTDPKNFYKKKSIVDFLGSVKPEPQSSISDASIMKLSSEFKNTFGGIDDLFVNKTRPNMTAAEHSLREQQRLEQWRKEELRKRYAVSQDKLLTSIKDMLKDFEGYQLLLQSDSYRQLQELVQAIETVPDIPFGDTAAASAYLDALRYGLGRMKSP